MPDPKSYHLPATKLIPNSPYPLLHYPSFFTAEPSGTFSAPQVHTLFASNAWQTQWIFRYGPTQRSHYHSAAHECMVVLTGSATIRFGVADTDPDMEANTYGEAREAGGVEVEAKVGDVFIIPAGVSHKTYDARPRGEFGLLTPGDGHGIAIRGGEGGEGGDGDGDVRKVLEETPLSGFTMIGAYPRGEVWDSKVGGEDEGRFEEVWKVGKPERDPVYGEKGGLCELW